VQRLTEIYQIGLAGLLASGCLIGFDADRLTGGDAGGGSGGGSGSSAGGDLGGGCDNFSAYAAGAQLPDWVDGRGTWRVVLMNGAHALGQTDPGWNGSRYVSWYDGQPFTDVDVSAVAAAQGNEACVLARVQDASTYYAACARDGDSRHPPEWRINLNVGGTVTRLSSGSLTSAGAHRLSLGVRGSRLTASIDDSPAVSVDDTTLASGNVGVSSDENGAFTTYCMVAR
jgi:hypothetical protein